MTKITALARAKIATANSGRYQPDRSACKHSQPIRIGKTTAASPYLRSNIPLVPAPVTTCMNP